MCLLPIMVLMDGYVTIAEVAREYRVSRSHVRNMGGELRLDVAVVFYPVRADLQAGQLDQAADTQNAALHGFTPSQALMRRRRRNRLRCSSVMPPHIPDFSSPSSARSRHLARSGLPAHIRLAAVICRCLSSPLGKNSSGSACCRPRGEDPAVPSRT